MLRYYGLDRHVSITKVETDRVFGWAYDSKLLEFAISNGWNPDDRFSAGITHGTQFSFREPGGVRPALQVCFHPYHTPTTSSYFLEIDLDLASPAGGWRSFFIHAGEVIANLITRKKTDQDKIAKLLNKRGIPA